MDTSDDSRTHDAAGDRLGMNEQISRRDFINGTLAASAGLWLGGRAPSGFVTPWMADEWTGYGGVGEYARSNGNTYEVMSVAHMMRDGKFERSVARATGTKDM
jgi:spermidine dehydrogenase